MYSGRTWSRYGHQIRSIMNTTRRVQIRLMSFSRLEGWTIKNKQAYFKQEIRSDTACLTYDFQGGQAKTNCFILVAMPTF